MPEYSRRDVLGAIGSAAAASVAGCQSEKEEYDPLSEVINNIQYRQRDLIDTYNRREGNRAREAFEEESMQLNHDPENVDGTSGQIDYELNIQTSEDGTLADLQNPERMERAPPQDERDQTEYHTTNLLGSLMVAQFQVPILGIKGEGFKDQETHEEYKERLGSVGAQIEDHSGNSANLYMPEQDVEDFWNQVETTLEQDTAEAKEETLQDLVGYCEENMEYSFERTK